MPLSANSRLGPYEIKSTLGVGGMGEVYRARDSRLNRDVAIKVLRQDSTSGSSGASADLRFRFEREARAVAALNHPNINAVYDFGVEDGKQYIVSELIEGESLRSLVPGPPAKSKSVPVRRLIEIAAQVADGLAAAHAAGVVHRDLKPENIMLAKDGRAKILDFGLARKTPAAASPIVPADSDETFVPNTQNLTSAGAVLGTASYMSPEQALGQETDYRSDQFSFGLILHEMASGKQAFAKPSSVETMAAIVREEPPIIEEKIPAPLKWIIDRCLAKEPDRRYESTRDLHRDLANLRDHFSEAYSSNSGVMAPVQVKARPLRWKLPAGVAAGCLLAGAIIAFLLKPDGQNMADYRYTPFASDAERAAWSPDGKAVAYAANVNGTLQVFLRYLNSPVPVQLTREKQDIVPFGWSSDRNHLILGESDASFGMQTHYKLYSLPTVGGQLEFIMDADCLACDLSRDGKAFATFERDVVEISDPLGSPLRPYRPTPFASSLDNINSDPWLSFSPDGQNILLLLPLGSRPDETWLLPYPGGKKSPDQIFILGKSPSFGGSPSSSFLPDSRHFVISLRADQSSTHHLWMADIDRNELTPLTTGTSNEKFPTVSPDGKRILYSQLASRYDVVSVSLQDGTAKTLITSGHYETGPDWARNQENLVWVTDRSGQNEIWIRQPDGSSRPAVTAEDFPVPDLVLADATLSPDGDRIVYSASARGMKDRLWISSLAGGPPIRLTGVEENTEWGGTWSPDGSRFVYLQSNQSGSATMLMMVKTSGNALPVKLRDRVSGSILPDWSPSGDWIVYRDAKAIGWGWNLISPDGKTSKSLGNIHSPYLAFSKDGKLLYGIQTGGSGEAEDRAVLFSLDPVTLKQKVIKDLGKDLMPISPYNPGIRFSLAPDGKSFVYSTGTFRSDLWMLTGYRQPGLWNQIKDAFHSSPTK